MRSWCSLLVPLSLAMPAMALEDAFRGNPTGQSVGLSIESGTNGDVTLGSQRFNWDRNVRYNLTFRQRMASEGRLVPQGGIDFGYLDALADTPTGSFDTSGLVLGLTGAVAIHLREDHDFNATSLSFVPYLRGGIGWQSTRAYQIIDGDYQIDDSVSAGRFELGCGFDIALRIRRVEITAGLGAQIWTIGTPAYNAKEIATNDNYLVFRSTSGDDTFVRLAVMFSM